MVIDHINGIPNDNRIVNLRDVDASINRQNQRKAQSRSKSGLLGVCWYKAGSKWQAEISVHGEKHHLGRFNSKEAAHTAYITAKRELHAGYTI